MRRAVCPRCGRPSEGGLCSRCLLESEKLLSFPDSVEITVCSVCGSKLVKGRWSISEKNIEEMAVEAVSDSLAVHKDLENPTLEIELQKRGATRYNARANLHGSFRGLSIEESCVIPVKIRLVACDRCSRMAGKYFEATVQVRGSSTRPLTDKEMEACRRMALSMADSGYRSGDQLSFVQDIKQVKGGLDIILGSTQLGKQLARAIQDRFGGRLLESSTLAGRKDGRDIYRTTILVRFPRLKKGDVIFFKGSTFEVCGFDGKRTQVAYLNGSRRTMLSEEDSEAAEILGNRSEAKEALVVAEDQEILEILDPESYKTVFASRPKGIEIKPGQEVAVIRTAKGFVVLG